MCADTGQIVVNALNSNDVSDEEAMVAMMMTLEGIKIGNVLGNGAYDILDCREVVYDMGGKSIIPPKKNAREQKRTQIAALEERDKAIQWIQELGKEGRVKWKQEVGYHQRSLVETHMFRHKTILGDRLMAQKKAIQATELTIKCDVLNRMTELGMPDSYKVAI